jgi:hypothetical protein
VREKITDPAYSAWFLPFGPPTVGNGWHVPQCDSNYDPPLCTNLYHDQGQTPGYPHGDGDCAPPACDVGSVPVGEYLFNFASVNVSVNGQTFIDWCVRSAAPCSNTHSAYLDAPHAMPTPPSPFFQVH